MTHEISQFMWGKWLISDGEKNRLRESGYGIIGSSPNIDPESFYPGEVLIGRPFLEVYDVNSYTLIQTKNRENLLWSTFYYHVKDAYWAEWKGENKNAPNRPFVMEHHIVIPKLMFYRLRFNMPPLLFSPRIPKLNKIYYSGQLKLDNIEVELASADQISHALTKSLNFLYSKSKDALLMLEILNNFSITGDCLTVVNCEMDVSRRLNLFLTILMLLPDKDAADFKFCTASYIKAKPSLFNVIMLEPDLPVSSLKQVDASRLVEKDNNISNGYGTLLLKMINNVGIEDTIKLMCLSTHRLADNPHSNGIEELKSLYAENLTQKRLNEGVGWTLEDLHGYIKKNRDRGVQRYASNIESLLHENMDGFLKLLKDFPVEILQNGFRKYILIALNRLSLNEIDFIFVNGGLAGTLSQEELQALSKLLSEKLSGNIINNRLDALVASGAIVNKEKEEIIHFLLKNKFDPDIFMIEVDKFSEAEQLPSYAIYINPKDIDTDFIAKTYSCLSNDAEIPVLEFVKNLQYVKAHIDWFHKFVVLALRHGKYGFLSHKLLGVLYKEYWRNHAIQWKEVLTIWKKEKNLNQSLPLLSLIYLVENSVEKEIVTVLKSDLSSTVDHLCKTGSYLLPEIDLKNKFLHALSQLATKNKASDIRLWLSKMLDSQLFYETGKYLLESHITLNNDADIKNSFELLELFANNKHDVNEVAKLYLRCLPKNLSLSAVKVDDRIRWFLHVAEILVKDYSINLTIYMYLAGRLDILKDDRVNAFEFHKNILSLLPEDQYKKEYLKGLQPGIRARLDAKEYLNGLSSISMYDTEVILDIITRLVESEVNPMELISIFERINILTDRSTPHIRANLVDKVGRINIPALPIYFYSIRAIFVGKNLLSGKNSFLDDLFVASLNEYQKREGSAEKLITGFLAQDYKNISLLYSALELSLPHEKKMFNNIKKLKDYTAKIGKRPL